LLVLALLACSREIALPEVSAGDGGGDRDAGRGDVRLVSPTRDAAADARPDRSADLEESCESVGRAAMFQHPRLILALDRSASMQERPAGGVSRLHGVQHVIEALIRKYYRAVYFGYVEFPVAECPAGSCCASQAVTPAKDSLSLIERRWSCEFEPATCQSTTKDSPIAEALASSRKVLDGGGNDFDQRHVFLMTDGEPACAASTTDDECVRSSEQSAWLASQDVSTTVFALTEALQTSGCLKDVANLGGTGATVPAITNDQLKERLEEKLSVLAREACSFRLNVNLDPAETLHVYLNGTEVKRDPTRMDGWEFEDGAPRKVTIYGPWCTKLSTSQVSGSYIETCRPG
jgi:hypothetical protein